MKSAIKVVTAMSATMIEITSQLGIKASIIFKTPLPLAWRKQSRKRAP
jgi:hypothetical protein